MKSSSPNVARNLNMPNNAQKSRLRYLGAAILALPFAALSLAHASTFTTLYSFKDKTDGGNPISGVIQDAAGNVYGETNLGGTLPCTTEPSSSEGCGTVYSISPTGGFKVLVSLTGANGAHGNTTMVLVGTTLYGATANGGSNNDGVVFSVNTDGTGFTLLHQFNGSDGSDPVALVAGKNGIVYGVAQSGGVSNDGVLFSITPGGAYTLLHNFSLPADSLPSTLLMAANGTLVGSSLFGGSGSINCHTGCGTVFSYVPSTRVFSTLYTLPSSDKQGARPYVGSIGPGPTVYVADNSLSFSLSQAKGYVLLAKFNNYTVGYGTASGPLYTPGGTLYGVVVGGPVTYYGSLYSIKDNVITDANVFTTLGGDTPFAEPTLTSSGSIIGTTSEDGSCFYCGSVWEYTP
jgi:uncharacterized repeat protein (TIGR03803 family)